MTLPHVESMWSKVRLRAHRYLFSLAARLREQMAFDAALFESTMHPTNASNKQLLN